MFLDQKNYIRIEILVQINSYSKIKFLVYGIFGFKIICIAEQILGQKQLTKKIVGFKKCFPSNKKFNCKIENRVWALLNIEYEKISR